MALQLYHAPLFFTSVKNAPIVPFTLTAGGGAAPYTYSAVGLPDGLSVDVDTGVVSGSPSVSGTFQAQFEVIDADLSLATVQSEFVIADDHAFFPVTDAGTSAIDGPGMLMQSQNPDCLGVSRDIPIFSVEETVLDAVAAMALAYS